MEATPTPRSSAPISPGRRRTRPHPAQHARKTAAVVSVGSFLALTGAFAAKSALSDLPATNATTDTSGSAVVTTDDGGIVVVDTDHDDETELSPDDWGGTPAPDAGTVTSPGTSTNTPPATTQSHGS